MTWRSLGSVLARRQKRAANWFRVRAVWRRSGPPNPRGTDMSEAGSRRASLVRAIAWPWLLTSIVLLVGAITVAFGDTRYLVRVLLGSNASAEMKLGPPVYGRVPPAIPTTDAAGQPHVLDLSKGDALLIVYDRHCPSCDFIMPRWLELIASMRRLAIPVYALSRNDVSEQSHYWRGLERSVQVLAPTDDSALTRIFGVRGTPCTILLRRGRVTAVLHGELDKSREAWLVAQVT
jgi:hypothetical protein